jgi:acyl-CoA thioesterase
VTTVDHRQRDREWLGIEISDDGQRAQLLVVPELLNPANTLYGGTAVAAAVTLMELLTDRFMVWVTVQFISTCTAGDTIDMHTVVSARGRRSAQVRVEATIGDREIFVAVGAVGTRREDGLRGQWEEMPDVSPPDECPPLVFVPPAGMIVERNHLDIVDRRIAPIRSGDRPNRAAMWSRVPHHPAVSPAMLGWHADMIGVAFAKAKPGIYGGTSLDNTIRFVRSVDTEWVLVELLAHAMTDGYGHGTVHVWSPDGILMATGSQSCNVQRMPTP